jgi:ATP-dependent Lon protease
LGKLPSTFEGAVVRHGGISLVTKSGHARQRTKHAELPMICIKTGVLFPGSIMPINGVWSLTARERKLIEQGRYSVAVFTDIANADDSSRISEIGTEALVTSILRLPDGTEGIVVRGERRIKMVRLASRGRLRSLARVTYFSDRPSPRVSDKVLATARAIRNDVFRLSRMDATIPTELLNAIQHEQDPESLCYSIAPYLGLSIEQQLELLSAESQSQRLKILGAALQRELELSRFSEQLHKRVEGEISEADRRDYLQEQIRTLKDELAEMDGAESEIDKLEEDLEKLNLPKLVQEAVEEELFRMDSAAPGSAEYGISYNYLCFIRDLPWNSAPPPQINLRNAERILKRSHFGLDRAKDGILEYLAVARRGGNTRGSVLLLDGPPGVGKTSLVSSIAEAMGRPFARISLGGMRDEAELRGHRRTYIGAMPGRILTAIKHVRSPYPVILLDEIDKIASDHGRSVEAALLEILDPSQNAEFTDNFLALPYSLENIFFVATSNDCSRLSSPLLDRMQIVSVPGYSDREKLAIVKKYLIPKIREEYRLSAHSFRVYDNVVSRIMKEYTREAGVRQLRRSLEQLGRKTVRRSIERKAKQRLEITAGDLPNWLGPPPFPEDDAMAPGPGMVNGLAYTENGGEMLPIEACVLSRQALGQILKLTGSLGKVMIESAETAWTLILSQQKRFFDSQLELKDHGVHLHFPDSATPKDGPSAGLAITIAITSAITGRMVPKDVAFSGEISLSGAVLPVGGIREKVLAAARNQCRRVFLPEQNRNDLRDLLPEDYANVTIIFVRSIFGVLEQLWQTERREIGDVLWAGHEWSKVVPVVAPGVDQSTLL